ncbi:MAG TPA: hypothetical protein VM243_20750 [Phycisphaerae bacterium]|nr:hypothetical protein [Phycisphaerae bacterium]
MRLMRRRCSERWGFVLWAVAAGALCGCPSSEPTGKWESWSYEQSEALTTAEQVERAQHDQGDAGQLREGPSSAPGEMPGNLLSEQERRAIQERYAQALREQAEQQRLASESARREAGRAGGGGQAD